MHRNGHAFQTGSTRRRATWYIDCSFHRLHWHEHLSPLGVRAEPAAGVPTFAVARRRRLPPHYCCLHWVTVTFLTAATADP
jgi:Ser/Thr protein kinase RdoA (MazF antagonist)